MTRNGFQLLIPLLVVMLSISVMNAILLQTTGRIVPELISEAVRPLVLASDTLMAVLISLFICNLLWIISGRVASIFKLAQDKRFDHLSPGTLLTYHMIKHAFERDVSTIDFLLGDDPFKDLS